MNTLFYSVLFATATLNPDYSITDKGVTYATRMQGIHNPPMLQNGYLTVSLPQTPNSGVSDRMEYVWVNEHDPNAPAFNNQSKYFGFRQQFLPGSPNIYQHTTWYQCWQGGSPTNKLSPPIEIIVPQSSDGTWKAQLLLRNDDTGHFYGQKPDPIILYSWTIVPGQWHDYVIKFRPDWTGNGNISLWIDGVKKRDFSGKVGYKPASLGGTPGALNTMQIKTGLYRHDGNPAIAAQWSIIKYANNYSQAAP